ncbi:Protein ASI3 [Pseudozyma hubeiensis]|nr:Protein ASI3 [Pseudozyma hubeiensis]
MPAQISAALHHSQHWLTSTAGAPLRAAYDFLFPPLNEAFVQPQTITRREIGADESIEQLEVWDTFSDSPWSFVTSRYAIALVIVAIVNNRVQHICRPRGGATARLSQLQRVALRLPSLVLLARAVLILFTVTADAFLAESNPVNVLLRTCTTASWRNAWLANTPMTGWASDWFGSSSRDALLRARDATALWAAFTSTCVAVVSDSIVRNLDADRDEPPAFNLVGFAFLLHFHSFSPEAPANEHVYLCILLQMLQIFAIAISRCRRPVYAPRLVISSVFGVSSLIHYALAARSGRYPFLEALSRTPEIALVLVVLLTVTLHAMTMMLLEGKIETSRLLFSRSNLPSLDEDWSLALFKLGTACMESTRLTGLEREVEPLVAWDAPYIELASSGRIELVDPLAPRNTNSHQPHNTLSSAYANTDGDASFIGGLSREVKQVRIEPTVRSASSTFGHAGLARMRALLHFAMVTLLVARSVAAIGMRKVLRAVGLPDPSVPAWVFRALRFARLVWHGSNGEARRRERRAAEQRRQQQEQQQRSQRSQRLRAQDVSDVGSSGIVSEGPQRHASMSETYRSDTTRSVQPDDVWDGDSDAEDNDYDVLLGEHDSDLESEDDEADSLSLPPDEVSGLLSELESFSAEDTVAPASTITLHSGTDPFNQLLLAHLTRPSTHPLTRSAYTSLLSPFSSSDITLAQTLITRRPHSPPSPSSTNDDARRLCVICCTSERNVICWPCRCLSLCMECREHLASRPPPRRPFTTTPDRPPRTEDASHLCPTCRTPVQAFSRLYIP